jgi:Rifampin ADP-ribosyl transferase
VIVNCVNETSRAQKEPMPPEAKDFGPFFHGTKADVRPGDLLHPGYSSNFGQRLNANYVYLTATLGAATWGAELAVGRGIRQDLPRGTHGRLRG